jgi:hypothetical protein
MFRSLPPCSWQHAVYYGWFGLLVGLVLGEDRHLCERWAEEAQLIDEEEAAVNERRMAAKYQASIEIQRQLLAATTPIVPYNGPSSSMSSSSSSSPPPSPPPCTKNSSSAPCRCLECTTPSPPTDGLSRSSSLPVSAGVAPPHSSWLSSLSSSSSSSSPPLAPGRSLKRSTAPRRSVEDDEIEAPPSEEDGRLHLGRGQGGGRGGRRGQSATPKSKRGRATRKDKSAA